MEENLSKKIPFIPILGLGGLSIFVLVILLVGSIILSHKPSPKPKAQAPAQNSYVSMLPSQNIFVYTRCYGGDRQPDHCNLYASSLDNPQELVVHTFQFPKVTQSDYLPQFYVKIIKVFDGEVFYDQSGNQSYTFGVIDIRSGKNIVIYSHTKYSPHDYQSADGFAISSITGNIYFTQAIPYTSWRLMEYNITTHKLSALYTQNNTKEIYTPLAVSGNSIFLNQIQGYPGAPNTWEKTFDMKTKKLTDAPKGITSPTFSSDGTKVAYITEEPIPNSSQTTLQLHVAQTRDITTSRLLYTNPVYLPSPAYNPYPVEGIASKQFYSINGVDMLSVTFRTDNLHDLSSKSQVNTYIFLLDSQQVYTDATVSQLTSIIPAKEDYQVIRYRTDSGSLKEIDTALLYEKDDKTLYDSNKDWYMGSFIIPQKPSQINISQREWPVLMRADNVFFIEKL